MDFDLSQLDSLENAAKGGKGKASKILPKFSTKPRIGRAGKSAKQAQPRSTSPASDAVAAAGAPSPRRGGPRGAPATTAAGPSQSDSHIGAATPALDQHRLPAKALHLTSQPTTSFRGRSRLSQQQRSAVAPIQQQPEPEPEPQQLQQQPVSTFDEVPSSSVPPQPPAQLPSVAAPSGGVTTALPIRASTARQQLAAAAAAAQKKEPKKRGRPRKSAPSAPSSSKKLSKATSSKGAGSLVKVDVDNEDQPGTSQHHQQQQPSTSRRSARQRKPIIKVLKPGATFETDEEDTQSLHSSDKEEEKLDFATALALRPRVKRKSSRKRRKPTTEGTSNDFLDDRNDLYTSSDSDMIVGDDQDGLHDDDEADRQVNLLNVETMSLREIVQWGNARERRLQQEERMRKQLEEEQLQQQATEAETAAAAGAAMNNNNNTATINPLSSPGGGRTALLRGGGVGPSSTAVVPSPSPGNTNPATTTTNALALVPGAGIDGTSRTLAPQVQVIDGRIVVNRQSLTIQAQERLEFTRVVTEDTPRLNSMTYMNRLSNERWTVENTELFYKALSQFGTDFTLISSLFPGRQRRHLKNKYTRENKVNPKRVDEALKAAASNNAYHFKNLIEEMRRENAEEGEDAEPEPHAQQQLLAPAPALEDGQQQQQQQQEREDGNDDEEEQAGPSRTANINNSKGGSAVAGAGVHQGYGDEDAYY